ncbi:hypothetical protein CSUI_001045 [Cystoisospora suis]|uniref:Rhodanese domain-containing protein n=1 Tax=Cystoisospora suis TaxID=483139 RepID=A0A2C6LD30_9APIC|nr:hypothetical protein CSUI_001045 [Cystoisospora suis]
MTTPAVDFAAMLAEARREAAQRRLAALGSLQASHPNPENLEVSPVSPPASSNASCLTSPTSALPWPKPISPSDLFNLLQAPSERPQGSEEGTLAARVCLVDLRDEDSFREKHIRQAFRANVFLDELRQLRRRLKQRGEEGERRERSCSVGTYSLPEKVVFYAGSAADDSMLSSFTESSLHMAGALREAREQGVGRGVHEAGSGDPNRERSEGETKGGPGTRDERGQESAGRGRAGPDSPRSLAAAAVQELSQVFEANRVVEKARNVMPPRLFVLKGGFAAFVLAYPFLCLSAEESATAADKMHPAAAAALMSYPREICHFSVSTPSDGLADASGAGAFSCTPFFGLYVGTMLHAISRGVRRRLRISTVLDLSAEGLPPTIGNCSCTGCTASGCKWREGSDGQETDSAPRYSDERRAVRGVVPSGGEKEESLQAEEDKWQMERLDFPTGSDAEMQQPNQGAKRPAAELREEEGIIAHLPLRLIRPIDKFLSGDRRLDSSTANSLMCSSGRSTGGLDTAAATTATRYALPLQFCVNVLAEGLIAPLQPDEKGEGRFSDDWEPPHPEPQSKEKKKLPERKCKTQVDQRGGDEKKHGLERGSVLVVHSSDVCSVSGTAAVLAAYLSRKRTQSGFSSVSTSGAEVDRKLMKAFGSADRTSIALALLMKKWPALRLEPQHMRQLKRFCESEAKNQQPQAAAGEEVTPADNRTEGEPGDKKERGRGEGGWEPNHKDEDESANSRTLDSVQQGQTARFRGVKEDAPSVLSSRNQKQDGRELRCNEGAHDTRMLQRARVAIRDSPRGECGKGDLAGADGLDAGTMLRMTLDLCRLPSSPVYLSRSGAVVFFSRFRGSEDKSASLTLLSVLTGALVSKSSTALDGSLARGEKHKPGFFSSGGSAHSAEERGLIPGFQALLRGASAGIAVPAERETSAATNGTPSSSDSWAARSDCPAADEIAAETVACLLRMRNLSDEDRGVRSWDASELVDNFRRRERVQVPLEEVWRVLASCVACWVSAFRQTLGVTSEDVRDGLRVDSDLRPGADASEEKTGENRARNLASPSVRIDVGATIETREAKAIRIWESLTELIHSVHKGLRQNACPPSNCMAAVGAFLVNLSLLWRTLVALPDKSATPSAARGVGSPRGGEFVKSLSGELNEEGLGRPDLAVQKDETTVAAAGESRETTGEPGLPPRLARMNTVRRKSVNTRLQEHQKQFKKELVSLLVFVVGSEAASLLECAAETESAGEFSRATSQASRGGNEGSLSRPRDSQDAAVGETFFGRPTLALRLALVALYGAVINPLFVESKINLGYVSATESGTPTRDAKEQRQPDNSSVLHVEPKAPAGTSRLHRRDETAECPRVSSALRRLTELFQTKSLALVLDLAEVWSATHPREGTEALQLLRRLHEAGGADVYPHDEDGGRVVPASLGLVLRPIVVVAGEVESYAE